VTTRSYRQSVSLVPAITNLTSLTHLHLVGYCP
jgi:hypothetical protein